MSARRAVAVVTGGRKGIGRAIALALAGRGFDIALTGIEADAPDDLLDEIKAVGGAAIYVQSDLADVATHQSCVAAIMAAFDGIDCLVNNAGIASVERGDFLDLKPENFDRITDVNLRGTVFFTQAVARSMLATTRVAPRSIINITSVSAVMSSPERMDYAITKAALSAFTQGLTLRLAGEGISVFEVRPGIIRTDMTAKVSQKYDAQIEAGLVPMKRWGEAQDVGSTVAALAGGDFGFATGSVIHVDGGLSISRL